MENQDNRSEQAVEMRRKVEGDFKEINARIDDFELGGNKIDLVNQSQIDALTQALNRSAFLEKVNLELRRARRSGQQSAILFVDLDHFKHINDSFGHSVGDALLKDATLRLAACIRETDSIARFGGDEFIIFLNDLEQEDGAQYVARRILEQFNGVRAIAGQDLLITVSIGIAVYPHNGASLEQLLRNADTAMYGAKESGRNRFQFYSPGMHKSAIRKMHVERVLRRALDKKEFVLFYQPIVNAADSRIRGFEALLHGVKTEGDFIFPDELVSVAEETGLIVPIGAWVIQEACRFNKKLLNAGHEDMVISVNVSMAQIRSKGLEGIIKSALNENGLRPELLEIEVSGGVSIESFDPSIEVLNTISALGVLVSLGHFGTGVSSLAHLQKLPIRSLKIDRLFIKEIAKESAEHAMIPAIIDLAHKLKLGVIAEGVETGDQLEILLEDRCDYAQGYFISKPVPAERAVALLTGLGDERLVGSKDRELLGDQRVQAEIGRHRWLESEKTGKDIGLDKATRDWINCFSDAWAINSSAKQC